MNSETTTESTPSVPTPPPTWYIELNGERKGPMAGSQVQDLISEGKLSRESLSWQSGEADWKPLAATSFGTAFRDAPPPLSAAAVPNGLVWTLAFAPLIGAFFAGLVASLMRSNPDGFWWITLLLNIGLSLLDEKKLKAAGYDTKAMGGAWIVPVYLYKRATILKHNLAYFGVWVACFVFTLLFG